MEKGTYRRQINTYIKKMSKLKVETLTSGDGINYPKEGQSVTVHYCAYIGLECKQNAKFDSTRDRGKPFKFKLGVGQVIKGLDDGVAQLSIGKNNENICTTKRYRNKKQSNSNIIIKDDEY